jgi:hypothetical protein
MPTPIKTNGAGAHKAGKCNHAISEVIYAFLALPNTENKRKAAGRTLKEFQFNPNGGAPITTQHPRGEYMRIAQRRSRQIRKADEMRKVGKSESEIAEYFRLQEQRQLEREAEAASRLQEAEALRLAADRQKKKQPSSEKPAKRAKKKTG